MVLRFSKVEFQCSTDSSKPLIWSVTYAHRNETIELTDRGNLTFDGKSWYRNHSEQYNLIIKSVRFRDAGKYKCSEGYLGPEVEADLSVIGKYSKDCEFL